MRTIRALTIAVATVVAGVVAVPTSAIAQNGRGFTDAWFWGLKAGGMTFADSGRAYKQAPLAGIEWLITRTKGGLYISAGQTFLTATALTLRDPTAPVDSGYRSIRLNNLRRLDVAMMGFPGEHIRFHPYVGIGFSLNEIGNAAPSGPFATSEQLSYANQVIQDAKVKFSPLFIGGAQWRMRWSSVFGQLSISPAQKDFLLYNGRPFNFTYEVGLRYNVGSSIERQ
jgi:hypothetical protein